MNRPIPTIRVAAGEVPTPDLARRCLGALNAHPWFTVVTGRAAADTPGFTAALLREIAGDPADADAMTLSRIELNPEKAASRQDATSFSRTSAALEAHTDSSFLPRPHEVVAFQFVRDDPDGGDSIVIPLDAVLTRLGPGMTEAAAREAFRFGETVAPMLTGPDDRRALRFYRTQIEKSEPAPLSGARLALIEAMSAAAGAAHEEFRFHAGPGDIVLINNLRALHARTAFSDGAGRLMFRVRCHSRLVR